MLMCGELMTVLSLEVRRALIHIQAELYPLESAAPVAIPTTHCLPDG